MSELGKRIKARREQLGVSQQELANMLGYDNRSSISKIESGENDIPQSKIAAFAKALQTTPSYFVATINEHIYIDELIDQERQLIQNFRKLCRSDQEIVLTYIATKLEMEKISGQGSCAPKEPCRLTNRSIR